MEEYKEIKLTQGKVALVDPEYFDRLNSVKWYAQASREGFYALRHVRLENGRRGISSMHREVLGAVPGEIVDHINRDRLDNRWKNLRVATEAQNRQNVGKHTDAQTSEFKGVCFNRQKKMFMARIGYDGEMHHIGYFVEAEDAARAYDREALIHFGEFAYLNFPEADVDNSKERT